MRLYVVRHGEAEKVGGTVMRDADRRLTARGEESARMMAEALARIDSGVHVILSSPLARAVQTANILRHGLHDRPLLHVTENLSLGFRPKPLFDELLAVSSGQTVVAVGHQPDLTRFLGYLIADSSHAQIAMSTLAIASLELDGASSHHQSQLHWLLTADTVSSLLSLR